MGIIGWIVLGLIVGALAKLVMPGTDKGGIFITMALGVVGGILGGFIGRVLFNTDLGTFWDIRTWLLALLGAVIVLAIYRAVTGRRKVRS
jgi:uncharacterized membrane protein YeaQ/YmgE (transglycosylase-associated protein family)